MGYLIDEQKMLGIFKESALNGNLTITSDDEQYIKVLTGVLNHAYEVGVKEGMDRKCLSGS